MLRFRSFTKDSTGHFPKWTRDLQGRSGVYSIRYKGSPIPAYIGESHSGRLRQTLLRHFQKWDGPTAGPVYDPARVDVAVIVCPPGKAVALQNKLIAKHRPRGNTQGKPDLRRARVTIAQDDGNPF